MMDQGSNATAFRRGMDDGAIAAALCGAPTPAYVYDLRVLKETIARFRTAFADIPAKLYFATMANDRPEFLGLLSREGLGACVNSIKHLDLARSAGFADSDIQFTASGLPSDVLRVLVDRGIAVNLDSVQQILQWSKAGGRQSGLRINAASLSSSRPADRLGVAAEELGEALALARSVDVNLVGLHVYLGTNLQSHDEAIPALEHLFSHAASLNGLRYLNIGGGIGVDYSHASQGFDVEAYGAALATLTHALSARHGRAVDIIIEPGRAIAASAASFVTRVTDFKTLRGTRYVCVDASVATFPRPLLHPEAPHRIRMLGAAGERQAATEAVVVGCTTFSRDILGRATLPMSLSVGDLLVVDDAGAYSESMVSRFLGQMEPGVHYVKS